MINVTKVYVDKSGGGRLYISESMMAKLGWKDHDRVIVKQHDSKLKILLEKDGDSDEDEHRRKGEGLP